MVKHALTILRYFLLRFFKVSLTILQQYKKKRVEKNKRTVPDRNSAACFVSSSSFIAYNVYSPRMIYFIHEFQLSTYSITNPDILIKLKLGVVITIDEQRCFRIAYFEKKTFCMTRSPMNLLCRGLATLLVRASKILG